MADTNQISQAAASLDLSSLAANLAILAAFISASVVGVWKGLKTVRESTVKSSVPAGAHVAAGMILESATMHDWTRTNAEVRVALDQMRDAVYSLRNTEVALCGDISDLRHAITELKHRIELSDHHRGH